MNFQVTKTHDNDDKMYCTPFIMYGKDANERMFGVVIFNLLFSLRLKPKNNEKQRNLLNNAENQQKNATK